MIRTTDPTFINYVANHPDVRPQIGTDGKSYVDMGILLAQPGAFALINGYGGVIFTPDNEGGYEFHTMFLPSGRGRIARDAGKEVLRMMFEDYGAAHIKTYVPHDNRAALGLVRILGFERTHEDAEASYWRMRNEAWQARAGIGVS